MDALHCVFDLRYQHKFNRVFVAGYQMFYVVLAIVCLAIL